MTVTVIEVFANQRAERDRKEELILQMGSPDHAFAIEATRLLKKRGWLKDGSLKEAYLREADLREIKLHGANLQGAYLHYADLSGAKLNLVNLQNAYLRETKLEASDLYHCNLKGAKLIGAILDRAELLGADLQGAILEKSSFNNAKFDRDTILPDGSHWKPHRDIREFTYPEIWKAKQTAKQSGNPDSPPPTTEPPPLTFEYIERPQRPRWRDMR